MIGGVFRRGGYPVLQDRGTSFSRGEMLPSTTNVSRWSDPPSLGRIRIASSSRARQIQLTAVGGGFASIEVTIERHSLAFYPPFFVFVLFCFLTYLATIQ